MTNPRANAYRRIVHTLQELGPAKLWPREQACIREAADALLFCRDLGQDADARAAVAAVTSLADDLIDADRLTSMRAQRLLDDIWECGPSALLALPVAA
ncbi:MAG: hypothetical protein QOH46_1655 [Solirubrobacteraceae bacterium]|jgi:NAD(P)H-hydrate repair Nnr-like enzyme with NAD(P)H-hydrate dehydratase domain|nr:hypothetical protein [Solirubrobacteraceae bacterium]